MTERTAGDFPISPTTDWGRDLDILDPRYVADPFGVWRELRDGCPVAFSERRGRAWMPVNYDDISTVAHDTDHFSSRRIGVVDLPENEREGRPLLTAPPITSDPPEHTWARRILLPAFAPGRIETMTPITQSLARELLDSIAAGCQADAARDYAQHIPVRVIAHMLGVPAADEEMFTNWAVRILQEGFNDLQKSLDAIIETLEYFGARVDERAALPADQRPDDLITLLVETEIDGEPLDRRHLLGTCFLLLLAGIDTTWSAIGSSLWHLATHPEDQARLRAEPDLIDSAVEELLRVYSPVTMAREVIADVDVAGCPMKPGDKVLMSFPAANRDPAQFENPDEFIIDRERNRHVAFGSGIHRCLGSNLARMELRVAIQEWLTRIPTFELADPAAVTWTGGQVRGPRAIPVRWSATKP
ncbi:MAG: cytochrome P450 [Ilumatobacter sp.]|uniref:cytochrome P450 n=1 Tax=Ilumatobacter sp. TaxID=1967498 RepID=UPI00391D535A